MHDLTRWKDFWTVEEITLMMRKILSSQSIFHDVILSSFREPIFIFNHICLIWGGQWPLHIPKTALNLQNEFRT